VLELKLLLETSKKGNLTCTQFIQHMQSLADQLHSIGSLISDQDLVIYTFSMRQYSSSMPKLHSLLLTHEARFQANLKAFSSTSAHLLSSSQSFPNNSGSQQSEVLYTSSNFVRSTNTNFYTKNSSGQ
jgi:hypothetical protein